MANKAIKLKRRHRRLAHRRIPHRLDHPLPPSTLSNNALVSNPPTISDGHQKFVTPLQSVTGRNISSLLRDSYLIPKLSQERKPSSHKQSPTNTKLAWNIAQLRQKCTGLSTNNMVPQLVKTNSVLKPNLSTYGKLRLKLSTNTSANSNSSSPRLWHNKLMTTSTEKINAINSFSPHSNMPKFLTKIGKDSSPISAEPGQTWNQNLFSLLLVRFTMPTFCPPSPIQYWQTSGPKFGPTRYPADRSIHWAGIGLGILSPGPNWTQFGRTDMYAKCGSGKRFFRSIGSVFACRKPGKTSVEPLMKWDYPTRHFLSSTVPKSL